MDPERFGKFCSAEEWAISDQPHATIHCLTKGQAIGLVIDSEAGIFSCVAATIALALVGRNVWIRIRRPPPESWRLFEGPPDIYLFWLFWADLVAGIGFALNIPWIVNGKVYTGATCTTQGAMRQIGEVAVAIITLSMAIHTWAALWLKRGMRGRVIPWMAIAFAFLFGILSVVIGIMQHNDPKQPFEAPTPYWCWIGPEYIAERLALQYAIIWLTVLVSLILYFTLFFLGRGNITRHTSSWWRFKFHGRREYARFDDRATRAMVAYPVAYSLNVIPLSIVRWIGLSPSEQPLPAAYFAVSFLFGLSGVFNVGLFFLTRANVLLFGADSATAQLPTTTRRSRPLPLLRAPSLTPSTRSEVEREPKPLVDPSALPTASSSNPADQEMSEVRYGTAMDRHRLTVGLPDEPVDWAQAWHSRLDTRELATSN